MAETTIDRAKVPSDTNHATPETANASKDSKYMAERRQVKFWEAANIRLTVINSIVVAIVGIAGVYTSNLLSQQALANRVTNVENKTDERYKARNEQFDKIEKKLDTNVITPQVLELNLKPIRETLTEQKNVLEQIRVAVIRNPRSFPIPNDPGSTVPP